MITKLILDAMGIPASTPVEFLEFVAPDHVQIRLPNGRIVEVRSAAVEAGHEPEETLSALSEALGIPYDTLARYAREGRFLARRSGNTWLSTRTAVEYAGIRVR